MAEKPQKLSLKRWPGTQSSRGMWLVKELPGVIIISSRGQCGMRGAWEIAPLRHEVVGSSQWSQAVWGKNWELSEKTQTAAQGIKRHYGTRREALCALEAQTCSKPETALADLLQ